MYVYVHICTWVYAHLRMYMHTDTATDQKINIHNILSSTHLYTIITQKQ